VAKPRSWRDDASLTEVDRLLLANVEALYGPPARNADPQASPRTRRLRRGPPFARTLLLALVAGALFYAAPQGRAAYQWAIDTVTALGHPVTEDIVLERLAPKCRESRTDLLAAADRVTQRSSRLRYEALMELDKTLSPESRAAWPVTCATILDSQSPP